ncbi:MAG: hypothetical protein ABT20_08835 [Rubrivivax sp. SCN 70-15]|nr:MAG: hypothetical protein ABT20_08835 [Rubrivivax sp. SCN 70-15]
MSVWKHTALACALAAAFPGAALAQSNEELLKELKALQARVSELEKKIEAADAQGGAPQWGMTRDQVHELNRVAVQSDGTVDALEAQGLKDLKISGYFDPTYIYNKAQDRAGFQFLNPVATGGYSYDNGYFGTAAIDFQKELDGGTKWRLTLMPNRGAGSIADTSASSIVHEASVSIPLGDLQTRLIAGQIPDWSGYEYTQPNTTKLVTRGLLLDFTEPTAYTGAGVEVIRGKWDVKAVLANFNQTMVASGHKSPVVAYRADYSKGEFSGFGFAGVNGRVVNFATTGYSRLDLFEADAYFIRGDLTLQGQVGFGRQKQASITPAADGSLRDAQWWGLSGLVGYKVTPRFELAARLDYINDSKNGGGLLGYTAADGVNGIGPNATLGCAPGSLVAGCDTGANRAALALGFNYMLTQNTMFKAEYRLDRASQPVFLNVRDGSYTKTNQLLGTSVVVSF